MLTFISKFDPRKGEFQVKLGEIRSDFKTQNFLTKTCLSCTVLPQYSTNVFYFYVRQLGMPKITFQECDVITFTCFFYDCTAKYKDIALKFSMYVACM